MGEARTWGLSDKLLYNLVMHPDAEWPGAQAVARSAPPLPAPGLSGSDAAARTGAPIRRPIRGLIACTLLGFAVLTGIAVMSRQTQEVVLAIPPTLPPLPVVIPIVTELPSMTPVPPPTEPPTSPPTEPPPPPTSTPVPPSTS